MPQPEPKKRLTDLELEIMQVVWDAGPVALTVRNVVERMAEAGRELAYTTVQTMMNILKKKGVLVSEPGAGRAHEYQACVSRSDASKSMTHDLVDRLFRGEAQPLLAQLLSHESVSRDELERLKAQIEDQLDDDEEGGEL